MTTNRIARYLLSTLSLLTLLRAAPAWSFASSLDRSFGGTGFVKVDLETYLTPTYLTPGYASFGRAVACDAEGRILVAGETCRTNLREGCQVFAMRFD